MSTPAQLRVESTNTRAPFPPLWPAHRVFTYNPSLSIETVYYKYIQERDPGAQEKVSEVWSLATPTHMTFHNSLLASEPQFPQWPNEVSCELTCLPWESE